MNLADNVLRQVNKKTIALEVWKKLYEFYLLKSLSSRINLKVQFFNFKMDSTKSLETNLDDLTRITIELDDSSEELSVEN